MVEKIGHPSEHFALRASRFFGLLAELQLNATWLPFRESPQLFRSAGQSSLVTRPPLFIRQAELILVESSWPGHEAKANRGRVVCGHCVERPESGVFKLLW